METNLIDTRAPVSWLLVAAFLISPCLVRAEESTEDQAVAYHQRGIELYRAESYAEAIAQFLRAQELAPAPSNLLNISRCYERLGDTARAIEYLERYLEDPALEPERRERRLQDLERLRGSVSQEGRVEIVTTPPGAQIFVDGRPQEAEVVTPATLRLSPGEHMIEVRLEGMEPVRREVEVEASGAVQLVIDMSSGSDTQEGPEGPGDGAAAPRLTWTAFGQIGLGGSIALVETSLGSAFLVGFDVGAGLNLGRMRVASRGVEVRPVRLEGMLGLYYQPAKGHLLQALFTGRLGIALGPLPIRVEGEIGVGLCYVSPTESGRSPDYSLAVVPAISVSWQVLRWLEVTLRPARIEILGLANDEVAFSLRLSMDASVRFRY